MEGYSLREPQNRHNETGWGREAARDWMDGNHGGNQVAGSKTPSGKGEEATLGEFGQRPDLRRWKNWANIAKIEERDRYKLEWQRRERSGKNEERCVAEAQDRSWTDGGREGKVVEGREQRE